MGLLEFHVLKVIGSAFICDFSVTCQICEYLSK